MNQARCSKRLFLVCAIFALLVSFTLLATSYGPRKLTWSLTAPSKKRLNIVLVSEPRSGSSFTGEIFQEHADVFYLFEPLFHFLKLGKASKSSENGDDYSDAVSSFMKNLFNCTFNDEDYLAELKTARKDRTRCPDSTNRHSPWISRDCKVKLTRENLEATCRQRKLTVAKLLTTRLSGMTYPAMEKLSLLCDSSTEFECLFIYLVRDPRAVISSLLDIGFFDKTTRKVLKSGTYSKDYLMKLVRPRARVTCQTLAANIDYIQQLPSQMRRKLTVLRYEDLASAPEAVVKNLFDFVGLQVTQEVRHWLEEHTRPSVKPGRRDEDRPYSTVRNSLDVLDKWRRTRVMLVVNAVEQACGETLGRLGYIPVRGSEKLVRNLSVPLFVKKNPMARDMD